MSTVAGVKTCEQLANNFWLLRVAVMEKMKQAKRRAVDNCNATSGILLTPTTTAITNTSTTSVDNSFQDLVQQLENPATIRDFNQLAEDGGMTLGYQQPQHQLLQTCLDQLGNDITVIKTQLEKKKPKTLLLDINEKVDEILDFLKNRYSTTESGNIKMEP